MYDLAYSATLDAIFAVDTSNKSIYRSDGAAPAAFSTIGVVGGDQVRGLAFVPEPSTLMLLGMGAVGLLVYGWRRRKR